MGRHAQRDLPLRDGAPGTGYGVLENPHVGEHASTKSFEITITVGEDTWSYQESMNVYISRLGEEMQHQDGNTLTRVAE